MRTTHITLILLFVLISASCAKDTRVVRGGSMEPLIAPGTEVSVERAEHYGRGDLVVYNYSGNSNPLIKSVKAAPGDSWRIDGCNIIVNNTKLANSEGTPYCISDTRRLQLYAHDYPTIPPGAYLIMGDNPAGSIDGSVLGLVSGKDIIGKAIPR